MIAARVVERDAEPAERFPGTELDLHRDLDALALPTVGANDDELPAHRAPGEEVDAHIARLVDLYIVRRWRVVVAVAHVEAVDQPTDAS